MHLLKLDDLISYWPDARIDYKLFQFNGGEQHIQILEPEKYKDTDVLIEVSLIDSNKLIQTFLVTDALRRANVKSISLFAPYLPYARQDRVCNNGEALSIKVICDLINSQKYDKVYTLDNHSEVSTSLLNNYAPIKLEQILKRIFPNINDYIFVSPDAGALKKVFKLANYFGGIPIIECSKKRDTKNGKILETVVYEDNFKDYKSMLIIDDICDGGRTFIELAKELRKKGAKQIHLYVSHGIFSQGIDVFKGLIDSVYTTKSFINEITKINGETFRYDDF